jgi:two-component system, NtrC family, sensor kinase
MANQVPWSIEPVVVAPQTAPLRRRIVGVLMLVSVVPLLLTGTGLWLALAPTVTQQNIDLQRTLVDAHGALIDHFLTDRLHALELLGNSSAYSSLEDPELIANAYQLLNANLPGAFVDLGLVTADGRHAAYFGPYALLESNYADSEWFAAVMARGSFVSDAFLGARQVPHSIVAVRIGHGDSPWILRATLNDYELAALVLRAAVGPTTEAYVVNAAGVLQTPSRTASVLARSSLEMMGPYAGARATTVNVDGVRTIRVTRWLNQDRWLLVVEQPEAEVTAPVRRAFGLGAVVALAGLLVVLIAIWLATLHLTNRIDRANAERDALSRDLLRSAKLASLGELATGLAHEINNPLAIMVAEYTNVADDIHELSMPEEQRRSILGTIERCQRQVNRCSAITSKMLQFGRRAEPCLQPTALAPVIREVATLMDRQAAKRGIALSLSVADNLPPIVLDANELEQVLVNLIYNSVHAIAGVGRIVVSAERHDNEVTLAVKDTGHGIPPENMERVFQPFFTTKPPGQGTGLGLSVCYSIVRGWNATIDVDSTVGRGTTVSIHLPLKPDADVQAMPASTATPPNGELAP